MYQRSFHTVHKLTEAQWFLYVPHALKLLSCAFFTTSAFMASVRLSEHAVTVSSTNINQFVHVMEINSDFSELWSNFIHFTLLNFNFMLQRVTDRIYCYWFLCNTEFILPSIKFKKKIGNYVCLLNCCFDHLPTLNGRMIIVVL